MTEFAINSVEDAKVMFGGIPIDEVSVSMTINGAVLAVMSMYIRAVVEKQMELGLESSKYS